MTAPKPQAHWIKRAGDMYLVAARMSRIANDERRTLKVRTAAARQCVRAIEVAADFEELALRTRESA